MKDESNVKIEKSLNEINSLKQKDDAIRGLIASSFLLDVEIQNFPIVSKVLGKLDEYISQVRKMTKLERIEASMKSFVQLQNLPKKQQQLISTGLTTLAFSNGISQDQIANQLSGPDPSVGPAEPVW